MFFGGEAVDVLVKFGILFGKGPGDWDRWDSWDGWDGWNSWDKEINRQLETQSG